MNQTTETLRLDFGNEIESWQWGRTRPSDFPHIARIPGLGEMGRSIDGSTHTVNVNRGDHGAAWRMVVELGDETQPTRGWVNLPGGQSGNPFDPSYLEFLDNWAEGGFRQAQIHSEPDQLTDSAPSRLYLYPTTDKEIIQK